MTAVPRALLLAAALFLAVPAAAQQTPGVERVNGAVRIDFVGTELRLAIPALAEAAGMNVIYGTLPNGVVNLRTPQPVPVSMVRVYLENILRANGLELVAGEGGLFRVVNPNEGADPAAVRGAQTGVGALGQGGAQQIFIYPLRHAPAEDIARTIGALFGIGDPAGPGDNQMRALSDDLRDQRLDLNPQQPVAPGQPRGLRAEVAGSVHIVPDPRTNSLVIRATAADYQTIAAAINLLDTRPLQVLIEVVIAEVRRNRQLSVGIGATLPEQRVQGSDATVEGSLAGTTAGGLVLQVTRLGNVQVDVVLSALSSSGQAFILSRPVLLAQNNEEARILVGDQRPFIQISRALPTENAARDQVVQYRDVGTQLTIRPTINPDGYVTLSILQEVNSATGETQFGAPVVSTREAETRLLVKDGHTVVIGGLIDQTRSTANSGIPLLKDIPIIGNLFRSTSRNTATTELFVFLIPHVLYTDQEVDEATRRVREGAPRLDAALPDSIPLYWRERVDTLGAPLPTAQPRRGAPPRPPQPQPQPQPDGAQSYLAPADPRRSGPAVG
ncbi:MAG TPA: secretin N-terminal domain-containing protein [Longimicrobiaceae bacterium]|nr:secretin N-terminal domain-containing protein [Longimicrobiaceae bacterium]